METLLGSSISAAHRPKENIDCKRKRMKSQAARSNVIISRERNLAIDISDYFTVFF